MNECSGFDYLAVRGRVQGMATWRLRLREARSRRRYDRLDPVGRTQLAAMRAEMRDRNLVPRELVW